jgi:hypothetical protein
LDPHYFGQSIIWPIPIEKMKENKEIGIIQIGNVFIDNIKGREQQKRAEHS